MDYINIMVSLFGTSRVALECDAAIDPRKDGAGSGGALVLVVGMALLLNPVAVTSVEFRSKKDVPSFGTEAVAFGRVKKDVPSFGIDYTAFPRSRQFTFGINMNF